MAEPVKPASSRPRWLGVAMLLPVVVMVGAFAVFKVKQGDEQRVRDEGVQDDGRVVYVP